MGIILHHLQTPPPEPREVRPDLGIPDPLSARAHAGAAEGPGPALRIRDGHGRRAAGGAGPAPARAAGVRGCRLPAPGRPPTPPPVPFDIDRHETRVMPKTPPVRRPAPYPGAVRHGRAPHAPADPARRRLLRRRCRAPAPSWTPARPAWTPVPGTDGVLAPAHPGRPPTVFAPPRPAAAAASGASWLWVDCRRGALQLLQPRLVQVEAARTRSPRRSPSAAESGRSRSAGAARRRDRGRRPARPAVQPPHAARGHRGGRRRRRGQPVRQGVLRGAAHDAEMMARRVEGVKDVVSTIDIEEPERPEKAERTEQPERARASRRAPRPGRNAPAPRTAGPRGRPPRRSRRRSSSS